MAENETESTVLAAFRANGKQSLRDLAEKAGVSRERVRQILSAHGFKSGGKRAGRPPRVAEHVWTNRFGHRRKVATLNLGAVSELVVAADLLARGFDVYRAIAGQCAADLVAVRDGQRHLVEVRSANVTATGAWKFNPKQKVHESYDVLALVTPDGQIEYRPDPLTTES